MKAKLLFAIKRKLLAPNGHQFTLSMDLFEVHKHESKGLFKGRYKFSWIFFEDHNPMNRILLDCHAPLGPHLHIDQGPQIRLDEETLGDLLNAFRRAIQERFDFELEDSLKTFTFRYDPNASMNEAFTKLKKVIKTGRPHVESDQARTPSLKVMLTLITENRLELFRLIHDRKPNSLYELARLFNRDLGYVSKEVRILEALGLIKFEKRKMNGRDCLQPRALYDRIVFDFDLASKLVS